MPASVTLQTTIAASAKEVYRALVTSTALRTWFVDTAQVPGEPRKGGYYFISWNDGYRVMGEFTTLVEDKKVAFTWLGKGDPGETLVTIALKEKKGQTAVTLTHSGLGGGKAWKGFAEGVQHEWNGALENLKSVLETGEDLRIMRRPMLGIAGMSELTPEAVTQLGLPIKHGIRLAATVPGMGAAEAGLQNDDVIVSIGGQKTERFTDLGKALGSHHAGDVVKVVYYRAGQKESGDMRLSKRPLPPLPATGAEFAEVLRNLYIRDDAALDETFAGVSEEIASKRPAPKEWSAKEIITHLITSERNTQIFFTQLVTDAEPWYDDGDNDFEMSSSALIKMYPTVPDLLGALKKAEAETIAKAEAFPPEFIANKRNYWRVAFGYAQGGPTHVQTHLMQIKAALDAARK